MPIYEYKCLKCGHQFEHLQKINSDDLVVCPKCQAPKLQRLISHTSFQLKGSGWYVTDYKNKPAQDTKKGNKSESKDGVQQAPAVSKDAKDTKKDKATTKTASTDSKTGN